MNKTLLIVLCAVFLFFSGVLAGRRMHRRDVDVVQIQKEVVVMHDTLVVEKPMPVSSRVVDSLEAVITLRDVELRRLADAKPAADTVVLTHTDTLVVRLPRTVREYRDSSYYAVVSGYEPSLDRIETYSQTVTVRETRTLDYSRWGVSVYAGYGMAANDGRVFGAPAVGIAGTYNIIRFRKRR